MTYDETIQKHSKLAILYAQSDAYNRSLTIVLKKIEFAESKNASTSLLIAAYEAIEELREDVQDEMANLMPFVKS